MPIYIYWFHPFCIAILLVTCEFDQPRVNSGLPKFLRSPTRFALAAKAMMGSFRLPLFFWPSLSLYIVSVNVVHCIDYAHPPAHLTTLPAPRALFFEVEDNKSSRETLIRNSSLSIQQTNQMEATFSLGANSKLVAEHIVFSPFDDQCETKAFI